MRPEPLRGRNPSKTKRPVGQPAHDERGDRRRRARAPPRRRCRPRWPPATSRSPGSESAGHPGVAHERPPAHPGRGAPSTSATAAASVWSFTTSSAGPRCPGGPAAGRCAGCPRRRPRRPRPSSSIARGARSPRLPIGRAARAPGRRSTRSVIRTSRSVARPTATSVAERPASASSTARARQHRPRRGGCARRSAACARPAGRRRRKATSMSKRMPKVCTDRAGLDEERAVDAVAPEQPRGARAGRLGDLDAGQHLVVADQPDSRRASGTRPRLRR